MDVATCQSVAQRMDMGLSEVMYAPMGRVFVMRSGRKPAILPLYDTLHSPEYLRYLSLTQGA